MLAGCSAPGTRTLGSVASTPRGPGQRFPSASLHIPQSAWTLPGEDPEVIPTFQMGSRSTEKMSFASDLAVSGGALHTGKARQPRPCPPTPGMAQDGESLWQVISSMLRPEPGEGDSPSAIGSRAAEAQGTTRGGTSASVRFRVRTETKALVSGVPPLRVGIPLPGHLS